MNPINISMTTLIDFVGATSTAKFAIVQQERRNQADGYGPHKDFYKLIRDGIVLGERSGRGPAEVGGVLTTLRDEKKRSHYHDISNGYHRWRTARGPAKSTQPPTAAWTSGRLRVRINPELGLEFDGKRWAIKLYLKESKLDLRSGQAMVYLLGRECGAGWTPAILDIRRGKLCALDRRFKRRSLAGMLVGEARSFVEMWDWDETQAA